MINGIDEIAITNLDGLDTLATNRVCVAYKVGRKTLDVPPERQRATCPVCAGVRRARGMAETDRWMPHLA
jgi:adenylosuccinate synthase